MRWSILSWVCRLFVVGVLLASALGKSLDLPGFVDVLVTYQAIPVPLLWPIALLVTGLEWLLGVWVLSGWRLGTGALAALLLSAGYAVWMTLSLVRGLDLGQLWLLWRVLSAAVAMVFAAGRLGLGWHVLCVMEVCKKRYCPPLTRVSNGRRRKTAAHDLLKCGRSGKPRSCYPGLSMTSPREEGGYE
ncbi:MAG: hypothetical protein EWM72_01056 [Nitrospira sp.]|nr:MAG: hypothetical protein EWM72_01056 [Nitrospira sp.]